ncbi:phosphocarrier protein [Cryobacterium mesophilum]|uniref:Phosphocarrier protein HPr n=1 Tax=Terrimesophilobacter mesophilus TaxID=433647 RepID=A0A4R8VBA4_9MICO|nr:HPr family phosphocarrier protein [Terrimesophilobacter mesophilus]MBB5633351.1 phosphocarrier protein [Terrimesophilobacter mesophilus]TFB80083.1 HPr family phosphocarrier protein [Terrimesophilobacter mesophilus]
METSEGVDVISAEVIVGSKSGLHARPAAMVVALAGTLDPPVTLRKPDGLAVNARSIVKVLSQNFCYGDLVVVEATGDGAEDSVREMAELVARELEEDDAIVDAIEASD